jgi:hypothetical protein
MIYDIEFAKQLRHCNIDPYHNDRDDDYCMNENGQDFELYLRDRYLQI